MHRRLAEARRGAETILCLLVGPRRPFFPLLPGAATRRRALPPSLCRSVPRHVPLGADLGRCASWVGFGQPTHRSRSGADATSPPIRCPRFSRLPCARPPSPRAGGLALLHPHTRRRQRQRRAPAETMPFVYRGKCELERRRQQTQAPGDSDHKCFISPPRRRHGQEWRRQRQDRRSGRRRYHQTKHTLHTPRPVSRS